MGTKDIEIVQYPYTGSGTLSMGWSSNAAALFISILLCLLSDKDSFEHDYQQPGKKTSIRAGKGPQENSSGWNLLRRWEKFGKLSGIIECKAKTLEWNLWPVNNHALPVTLALRGILWPGQLRRMLKFLSRMSLLFSGNNSSSGKSGDKIKKKSVNRKIEGSAGGQSGGGGSRVERTRPPLIEGRAERAKWVDITVL